jgi:hypothetical protein
LHSSLELISHGIVFFSHNKTASAGLSAAKTSAEQLARNICTRGTVRAAATTTPETPESASEELEKLHLMLQDISSNDNNDN